MSDERMTLEQRRRWSWLQIMARVDEEYGRLLRETGKVDDLLQELKEELTSEQITKIEKIIAPNIALGRRAFELAAKYLVLPSELE